MSICTCRRTTVVVALTLVAIAATGCRPAPKKKPEEKKERKERSDRVVVGAAALAALKLTYSTAKVRPLSPVLKVSAALVAVPDRHAEVGPLVAGRVVAVRVNVGDKVKRGAALVTLDSPEVGRARAKLIAARAHLDVARLALDRERALAKEQATSQREVEQARGAYRKALAQRQAARAVLAALGVGARAPTRVRYAARVVLRSPIAGTVTARRAHLGRSVKPSATLVEVVDLAKLWLVASVYEHDMRKVAVGKSAEIVVRAYPDQVFRGKVVQVAGTVDARTRSVKVRVVLDNKDGRLRPGMFATARILGSRKKPRRRVLVIPWAAVQKIDDYRVVFIKGKPGVFHLRRIHTGERTGDDVEVIGGLTKGVVVVAQGSFLLKGQLLRSSLGDDD